jgi:hypothetical protein
MKWETDLEISISNVVYFTDGNKLYRGNPVGKKFDISNSFLSNALRGDYPDINAHVNLDKETNETHWGYINNMMFIILDYDYLCQYPKVLCEVVAYLEVK